MEPASKRSMVSAADAGAVLSPDVLWEILLRVSAKPLCRFRAACRSWRSLLSDPSFIKAHAALRPGLILALAGDNDRIDMMDMSGNVVRQISIAPEDVGVPRKHPGQLYLFLDSNRIRVVDPDTGAVSALPIDHLQAMFGSSYEAFYALGRVASTGQHKALRVVTRHICLANRRIAQRCDVFTLGDNDDDRRCWRQMGSPPLCAKFHLARGRIFAHDAVIQGVVYFLPDTKFPTFNIFPANDGVAIDTNRVMSFDLKTEEWSSATLPGPPSINNNHEDCVLLKLAKLNGSLVMLRHSHDYPTVEIDLWFATDLKKGVWVKEHSIRLELLTPHSRMDFQPLMVLDDGRVVFYYSRNCSSGNWSWPNPDWQTRIYDPRTKSCTDVPQHGVRYIAGMYRGDTFCLESQ